MALGPGIRALPLLDRGPGEAVFLVEEYKTGGISGRYEILNCTYGELKCRINRKLPE